jgi:hypothetical protein
MPAWRLRQQGVPAAAPAARARRLLPLRVQQAARTPPQTLNTGRSLGCDAYQQYSPLLMPRMVDGAAAAAGERQQAGGVGVPAAAQIEDLAARVSRCAGALLPPLVCRAGVFFAVGAGGRRPAGLPLSI